MGGSPRSRNSRYVVSSVAPSFHAAFAEMDFFNRGSPARLSRSSPDRGVVEVETVATNQREEPVLSFRRSVLVPRRPNEERGA